MNIVRFNVGGSYHQVVRATVNKYPETFLATLISERNSATAVKDETGAYFVDRNPQLFPFVLDFYRTDKVVFPTIVSKEDFVAELKFWKIPVELEYSLAEMVNYT